MLFIVVSCLLFASASGTAQVRSSVVRGRTGPVLPSALGIHRIPKLTPLSVPILTPTLTLSPSLTPLTISPSVVAVSLPAPIPAAGAVLPVPIKAEGSLGVLRKGADLTGKIIKSGGVGAKGISAEVFDGARKAMGTVGVNARRGTAGNRDSGSKGGEVAEPVPELPSFLSVANPEHAEWLAQVYQEALKSRSARRVLKQIQELTGSGREPVIIEVVDYQDSNEAEFAYDWELVRLGSHMKKWAPVDAAPSFIHELSHVVQKAEELPSFAVELELEAYTYSLKVARELGIKFRKGHFLETLSRTFKRSVRHFTDFISEDYGDSMTLADDSFEAIEVKLRRQKAASERAIKKLEGYLKARRKTYKLLKAARLPPKLLRSYRVHEITATQKDIIDYEANLYWLHRDLRILRTEAGRRRYLEYARRVFQDAGRFQRVYSEGKGSKNSKRIKLPTMWDVKNFEPVDSRPKKTKVPPMAAATSDKKLPAGFSALPDDQAWLAETLAVMGETPSGAYLLGKAEGAAEKRGRPLVIEIQNFTTWQRTEYDWDYEIVVVSPKHAALGPRAAAPLLAKAIETALLAEIMPHHSLEVELDGYLFALALAHELGIEITKKHPLFAARKAFRKGFGAFAEWAKKRETRKLLRGASTKDFLAALDRKEAVIKRNLKRKRAYLKARQATYRRMREAKHPRFLLRAYRADEVLGTETELQELRERLAFIQKDRQLLSGEGAEVYERFSLEVPERTAALDRTINGKD